MYFSPWGVSHDPSIFGFVGHETWREDMRITVGLPLINAAVFADICEYLRETIKELTIL